VFRINKLASYLEIVYITVASIFVILQGPRYSNWHFRGEAKTEPKGLLTNTLGSVIGWGAGYFLLFFRLKGGLDSFNPEMSDLAIFLLVFYGMTGYLPHILINKLRLGK